MPDLDNLYQCPYCGYTGETTEFFEDGTDDPICPDCGEDLTGDFIYSEPEEEEEL